MATEESTNRIVREANLRNSVKTIPSCSEQVDKVLRIEKVLRSVKQAANELDKSVNWEGYGFALGGVFITLGQVAWGVIDVVHEAIPDKFVGVKIVTGVAKTLKPLAETGGDLMAGKKISGLTTLDRVVTAGSGAIGVRHGLGADQGFKAVSEGAKALKGALDKSISGHKIVGGIAIDEREAKNKGKRNWEGHYKSFKETVNLVASLKSNTAAGGKIKAIVAAFDAGKNVGQWATRTYESTTDSFDSRERERKMIANDIRKLQRVLGRLVKNLDACLKERDDATFGSPNPDNSLLFPKTSHEAKT